jgi:hypothetical protein
VRSLWTIGLLVVIAIIIVPVQAQAFDFDETVIIEEGDYHARSFKVEGATLLRFRVTSDTGQTVDLLFLTPENFEKYKSEQPFNYESKSEIGVVTVEKDFMLFPGDYYLVIDNSERVGTAPDGDVQVSFQFEDYFPLDDLFDIILPITITAVLAVVIIIIILFVFLGRNDKGKRNMFHDRSGDDLRKKQ